MPRLRAPSHPLALLALVSLAGVSLLANACSRDPLDQARGLQAEGRFEESLEPLAELVLERPDEPEVDFLYGIALLRTGRPSEAAWPLRKAMESERWTVPAGLQLASTALITGNPDEAVEVAGRVLEREPDNTAALLLRATARVQTRRDYEGALADADRLLEIEPDNREILLQRALALLGLERAEEAEQAIEALEQSTSDGAGPTAGGYCGARAKFAEESGDPDQAERLYRACLEQFPANGVLLREAVEFLDTRGKTEDATAALRDALTAVPQARTLRVSLAVRLERLGDAEAAETLLREATRDADPVAAAGAEADLAGFLAQHGRLPEAIASYERALARVPEARERLLFPFSDTLVLAGEYQRALALADEMSIPGQRHLMRGRALLAMGETRKALDELTLGLETWPNQAAARYYAGVAAERLGDLDRAIEEYRYAVRAGSLLDARVRLARLHQALGETQPALMALRHDPDGTPLSVEAALLELELLATITADLQQMRSTLRGPEHQGAVLAALAEGARRRAGPAAAARVVLGASRLDLSRPSNEPALASLVENLCAAEEAARAVALMERLLERVEGRASLYTLHGQALECAGDAKAARAAFDRALELDAKLAGAHYGRARLAAGGGEADAALASYRLAEAETPEGAPGDARAALAVATQLEAAGRRDEARALLEARLLRDPLDGAAARRLAALLPAEADRRRTLERLAARLGRLGD